MYQYRCRINRIIDGDTVDVDIDLGFDIWLKNQRIRFKDIDAPEIRTRDLVEKAFGELSKQRVEQLLKVDNVYIINTFIDKRDGFGRILGEIFVNNISVNDILLSENLAVRFVNDKEKQLLDHLKNRSILINENKIVL